MTTRTVIEKLPRNLEPSEKLLKAEELAGALTEHIALDAERKKVADKYKRELADIQARIDELHAIVESGKIFEEVQCTVHLDFHNGKAEVTRVDTGEVVLYRDMTPEERQLEI
jgi:hypothetical protein